jgi:hypothetical protein
MLLSLQDKPSRLSHCALLVGWLLLSPSKILVVEAASDFTDELFSSTYEQDYDPSILDPLHAYGSPYGGFSRATRRRLAALPLSLPDLWADDDDATATNGPFYTTVREGTTGRLLACRVYHQDELEPRSLNDSMFAPPILKQDGGVAASAVTEAPSTSSVAPAGASIEEETKNRSMELETQDGIYKMPENKEPGGALLGTDDVLSMLQVTQRMDALEAVCGQIHKGWWSYEWCYQGSLTQFHVHFIDRATNQVEVQEITNLGDFVRREWNLDLENAEPNHLAGEIKEVARVADFHEGGALCPETGKPRTATVHLMCCTPEIIAKKEAFLRRGDTPMVSRDVAVYEILEDPEQVCAYNVTICTPLLCDQTEPKTETSQSSSSQEEEERRTTPKENESVMEILERTLGGKKPVCLQGITGGWWTYEYCHGVSIRQFHEVVGTVRDKTGTSKTTRRVDTDNNLGNPQLHVMRAIVPEDEWKFVANATAKKKTYFELEYTEGDICDDHDVRDAAIVAGNSGAKGLARASSVRFSCGERHDIAVQEDSTCHYVVDIALPDLCRHLFFQAPTSKKQVFKCLPVEEPEVNVASIIFG